MNTIFSYIYISLALLGVITIFLLGYDGYKKYSEIYSRIHIGRWQSRQEWRIAIEKVCKKWLSRTPIVQLKDERRLLLIDIIKGKYGSSNIQLWQRAALILALEQSDIDPVIVKSYLQTTGQFIPEKVFMAFALKSKGLLSDEQRHSLDEILDSYDSRKETLPYRHNSGSYIRFVDTLGFICPYLYVTGRSDMADRQIREFDKVLLYGILPPHAMNVVQNVPMGVYDWSRGVGWYILGIVFSEGNKARVLDLAELLLGFQKPEGGFGAMVFDVNSPMESSGTTLIGLLMLKAYEWTKESKYLNSAIRIENALMKVTRRNGFLDMVQGDTKGVGNYSTVFGIMPFAQGMCLYFSKVLDTYLEGCQGR